MKKDGIRLITRGDDAGSNRTANAAIFEAYRTGMLKNTSVMMTGTAAEDAASVFLPCKDLCIGLHTAINAEWDDVRFGPVSPIDRVRSLVDADGFFFQTPDLLRRNQPKIEEIMVELQAQLDLARELGFRMVYADMHMVYGWIIEGLFDQFDDWCRKEGLINGERFGRFLPQVESMDGDPVERYIGHLSKAEPGQYLVVLHPAYDNAEMRQLGHTGYSGEQVATGRDWERQLYTDPRVLAFCADQGIVAIRYDEATPVSGPAS